MTLLVDLHKTLGTFTINAQFQCSNEITALFGKSGAGKTSIVQMLAGLIKPENGRIVIDDVTLYDSRHQIDLPPNRRRVGYVFQDARLFPHMSVEKNLDYGQRRRRGTGGSPKFDQVVDVLDISHLLERKTRALSGGERQRVAIGRALLSAPQMLLMDEPLASLDSQRKAEIIPFVAEIQREFLLPVIYVSHSIDEVLQLADTVVLVAKGGVAAVGPVENILNRPDLVRVTNTGDAGTVIPARLTKTDQDFDMAIFSFSGGAFQVPAPSGDVEIGQSLRLRARARDVSIALKKPQDVSVMNIFKGTVASVVNGDGPQVDVSINVGETLIWSRITRKSLSELSISPGKSVYAMVKAVAIDKPGPRH